MICVYQVIDELIGDMCISSHQLIDDMCISTLIDELIDDATKHIMGGKEVEVLDEDVITFKFIGEDNE